MYVNLQIMEAIKIYTIDDGEYIYSYTMVKLCMFYLGVNIESYWPLGVSINVYNTANWIQNRLIDKCLSQIYNQTYKVTT